MIGTTKPFDKSDFELYDEKGRRALINYLTRELPSKVQVINNPNQYGIDVLVLLPDRKVIVACDVEVRYGNWYGDVQFPFDKINCIERKDHLWKMEKSFRDKIPFLLAENCKSFYVQLNKECNRAVIIDGEVILKQELIPWNNRKFQGEYVRQVPIGLTKQVSMGV